MWFFPGTPPSLLVVDLSWLVFQQPSLTSYTAGALQFGLNF
jgi:hypothetical protein